MGHKQQTACPPHGAVVEDVTDFSATQVMIRYRCANCGTVLGSAIEPRT